MNFLPKWLNAGRLTLLALVIPAVLLLTVDGLQWRSVSEYQAAHDWVAHTRLILSNLESFLSCIYDAETGQRGFLLTHKDTYLAPYQAAVLANDPELQTLRQLTADDPIQQRNLDQLIPLVQAKFAELAQTVALEKNQDHAGAIKIVMGDFGQNTMDQIRVIIARMHDQERGLLQEREASYQKSVRWNAELSATVIALGFVFIGAIFFLLRRLKRMDEMIKICAWSKLIEYEGVWISIEDYLTRRFHLQISHGMSDVEAKKMLHLINQEKFSEAV